MLELPEVKGYYVYILECVDHSYYTGWTSDIRKRYLVHCNGKGARYTKAHPPLACVYFEVFDNKISAMQREYEIKQLTRQEKKQLIDKSLSRKEETIC